jgi:hypothetical protein
MLCEEELITNTAAEVSVSGCHLRCGIAFNLETI